MKIQSSLILMKISAKYIISVLSVIWGKMFGSYWPKWKMLSWLLSISFEKITFYTGCSVFTRLTDWNQVLEFGSRSKNPSRPAWILTNAIPSGFRTFPRSSHFIKKILANQQLSLIALKNIYFCHFGIFCLIDPFFLIF